MMAFPIVFISFFAGLLGVIVGVIAQVAALLSGRSVDEITEEWTNR